MASMSQDALLGLLFPLWQIVIGGCVLVVLVISARRLIRRGPSRMGRALIVSGSAALAFAIIGLLISTW
jgi:hypothetical protein